MSGRSDDPLAIPDETRLFRRIDPHQIIYDNNRKERRPSSQCFQDSQDGSPMSVFAENVARENGEAPGDFLRGRWSSHYLVAVRAGWMRACGQKVYLDPHNQEPDDYFQSHAAVESIQGTKGPKVRKRLAEGYEWVIAPPNRFDPG